MKSKKNEWRNQIRIKKLYYQPNLIFKIQSKRVSDESFRMSDEKKLKWFLKVKSSQIREDIQN